MGGIDPNVLKNYNPDNPLQDIIDFAYARQEIFHKKEAGQPRPWTDDAVLDHCKFCNIFRDQDTVTKFIYQWVDGLEGDDLVANLIFARFANKPTTLERTGYIHKWYDDPDGFVSLISEIAGGKTNGGRSNRYPPWRDPYQHSSSFKAKLGYPNRESLIVGRIPKVITQIRERIEQIQPGEDIFTTLTDLADIWGYVHKMLFVQVILDYGDLGHIPQDIIVPAGSGVEPVLKMPKFSHLDYKGLMQQVMDQWHAQYPNERPMLPKDAEHTICEYRKYVCWTNDWSNKRIYRQTPVPVFPVNLFSSED